jgi:exodeoxyribonuclease VII large subunit
MQFTAAMGLFGKPADDEPPPQTVAQLAERIKGTLEQIPSVRVKGEISNFTDRGHWYFALKDAEARIDCALWQSDVRGIGFVPKDGDAVVVTGRVSFYPKTGRTQLYVRTMTKTGLGTLEERFRALCAELRGRGYFDDARKLPLPVFPRRIAIVTSATGAALRDCLATVRQRCPGVAVVVVDVRVQGEGAAADVARAITALDRAGERLGIDAMVVTRGGGSIEDLWAFNERVVADAVYARRRVPIVAAIGHESDTTVIELVADRRESTPTKAIMTLVPDRAELAAQLEHVTDRLRLVIGRSVGDRRAWLEQLARNPFLRSPLAPIDAGRRALEESSRRLATSLRQRIRAERATFDGMGKRWTALRLAERAGALRERLDERGHRLSRVSAAALLRLRERLVATERQLGAVGPEQTLARGYSYTTLEDGTLVRSVGSAPAGTRIRTVVADGAIASTVDGLADPGAGRALPRRERSPRRGPAPTTETPLFGDAGYSPDHGSSQG